MQQVLKDFKVYKELKVWPVLKDWMGFKARPVPKEQQDQQVFKELKARLGLQAPKEQQDLQERKARAGLKGSKELRSLGFKGHQDVRELKDQPGRKDQLERKVVPPDQDP